MKEPTASKPDSFRKEIQSEVDLKNYQQILDRGWGLVICFAGFMINFISGGLISSNGILLLGLMDLYEDPMSKTALVGSLFMGITNCAGPFVLLLMSFNASHRQIIICGGFFSTASALASAFAKKIEVIYFTYGILTGALFDATQSFDSIFFFGSGTLFIACIISSGIIYMQLKRKFYE